MAKSLSEGNLYAIYAVLADYRQARDQHDTQAIADIAAGLDAWLRSLLEIVKSQKVTWIPCEEQMPTEHEEDGVSKEVFLCVLGMCPPVRIGRWRTDIGYWESNDRYLSHFGGVSQWAEIQCPQPPKEGGDEE